MVPVPHFAQVASAPYPAMALVPCHAVVQACRQASSFLCVRRPARGGPWNRHCCVYRSVLFAWRCGAGVLSRAGWPRCWRCGRPTPQGCCLRPTSRASTVSARPQHGLGLDRLMLPCSVFDLLSATRAAVCPSTGSCLLRVCAGVNLVVAWVGRQTQEGLACGPVPHPLLALVALQGSSTLRQNPRLAPDTCVANPRPCIESCHSWTHLTWSQAFGTNQSAPVEALVVFAGVSPMMHFAPALYTCVHSTVCPSPTPSTHARACGAAWAVCRTSQNASHPKPACA